MAPFHKTCSKEASKSDAGHAQHFYWHMTWDFGDISRLHRFCKKNRHQAEMAASTAGSAEEMV
jgi:hypothetical protein